jgi:hypothetical protein
VDPALMTEEERVELAESLVANIPGFAVAKMPADADQVPELEKARTLATPVELPQNYPYLGAIEKAKVLESALDQLQKRNSELLTELEHRTQWEAVRLSTALRERDAAFTSHKAQIIQEAMHKTSEHYENVLKRQTAKLEGEMQLKLATTKTELEAQAQAAVASAVQKEREAARLNEVFPIWHSGNPGKKQRMAQLHLHRRVAPPMHDQEVHEASRNGPGL